MITFIQLEYFLPSSDRISLGGKLNKEGFDVSAIISPKIIFV